ncbi:biotin transporter BioY [Mycetocola saprophilus]|uniref:biotin transporter BioY n=1 Tax=Mycetocola saprophilus TaxID=76636 RepID=UPI003BEFA780
MTTRTSFGGADLARIAVFAALIAVLGMPPAIAAFGGAVPITAQTLGVMLAGTILGPWRGAAAVLVLELLAFAGLPVLAGGRGGAGVFVGPSVGYLIGWIAGVIVIGLIVRADRRRPTILRTSIGVVLGGIVTIYAFGIPFQAGITGLGFGPTFLSSLLFLPGDLIKAVIAVALTLALWRAYPRAFGRTSRRPQASSDTVTSVNESAPTTPQA